MNAINDWGLYWSWLPPKLKHHDITIAPVVSHPIVEQFGLIAELQEDGSHKMKASGVWLDIDFMLELGQ